MNIILCSRRTGINSEFKIDLVWGGICFDPLLEYRPVHGVFVTLATIVKIKLNSLLQVDALVASVIVLPGILIDAQLASSERYLSM